MARRRPSRLRLHVFSDEIKPF